MASYFGGSMYWATYCNYQLIKPKLVDADVDRECKNFQEVEPCKDIVVPAEA